MERALEHIMMHALRVEDREAVLFVLFESLGGGARNVMFWESDHEVNA
jgi:hypothetical protein